MVDETIGKKEEVTQPDASVTTEDIKKIDAEITKTETATKDELKKDINNEVKEQVKKELSEMTTQERMKAMEEENKKLQETNIQTLETMKQLQEKVDNIQPQRKGLVDSKGNPTLPEGVIPMREPTQEEIGLMVDNAPDKIDAIKRTLGL